MTALLLGLYGLLLSRAVPPLLARARWPSRAPRGAVVLWQAVVLASGLSAVGVVLAGPEELVRAHADGSRPWTQGGLAAALLLAAVIVGRLLVALAVVVRRARAQRERQRALVDLLGQDPPQGLADPRAVRVLAGPVPLVWCIPGRGSRVVLSDAAVAALAPDELAAVVAHERTHLRARHELVVEFFDAVQRAVPPPLRSAGSTAAVGLLLEMLADDGARRAGGPDPVRRALTRLGDALRPAAGDATPPDRAARLARLAPGAPPPSPALEVAAWTAAASLLVAPTLAVVLPWLTRALAP